MKMGQCLQRVVPQSTFSVTMVTIACIILIAAFLIKGIDHVNDDSRMKDVATMVGTQAKAEPVGLPETLSGEPAVEPEPKPARYVPASVPVKPAARNANRATTPKSYVATLTRMCDCCWAENADAPKEGSKVRVGQTLNVTSGLVEIAFACGAKAILQGPAILEIQTAKTSDLKVGRITADVPDDIEGFKIQTPTAVITSLASNQKTEKPKTDDSVAKDAKL